MDQEHDGKILFQDNNVTILDCEKCGFAHMFPFPSLEEVNEIYQKHYYESLKPQYIEKDLEDLEWVELNYERKYRLLMKHLKVGSRSPRILDIGSSGGFFLHYFMKKGWDCLGIEPSPKAVSFARERFGLNVFQGSLEDFQQEHSDPFDLINICFVLEHCLSPQMILHKAYQLLKPRGFLLLEVPNDFNPLQELATRSLGIARWWIAPPQHINYFTFQSFSLLLESMRFSVRERTTTWPMEIFLIMGLNYVGNDQIGQQCHSLRKTMELNFLKNNQLNMIESFYQTLTKINWGRTIIILGQKQS